MTHQLALTVDNSFNGEDVLVVECNLNLIVWRNLQLIIVCVIWNPNDWFNCKCLIIVNFFTIAKCVTSIYTHAQNLRKCNNYFEYAEMLEHNYFATHSKPVLQYALDTKQLRYQNTGATFSGRMTGMSREFNSTQRKYSSSSRVLITSVM